jgi:hypothetical protein
VPALGAALRLEAADLLRQFAEGVSDLIEDDATAGRQPKHPCAFRPLGLRGTQPPAPGHSRENWIERARTQVIAVVAQFLEHPLAIDALLLSMMKDVNLPEREEKLPHDGIAHFGMIAAEGDLLQPTSSIAAPGRNHESLFDTFDAGLSSVEQPDS